MSSAVSMRLSMRGQHAAFAFEVTALQLAICLRSLALASEYNSAVVSDKRSVLVVNPEWVSNTKSDLFHFDSRSLQYVIPEATRTACGALDALTSGLALMSLLSFLAKQHGSRTSTAFGLTAVLGTLADFTFLSVLGIELNVGVLKLAASSAWMMRFVVLNAILGGELLNQLFLALTFAACAIAGHMLLAASARLLCASCMPRRPLLMAALGLAARMAMLPSHPSAASPSLMFRVGMDTLCNLFIASPAATDEVISEQVELRRPYLVKERGVGSPQAQDTGAIGVVLLVLEATNAEAVSPLYAPAPMGVQPTAPFLTSLAALPGTITASSHFATMPNTNKALIELLCGLTPRLETSWSELDADFVGTVREECLPQRLSAKGWRTLIASPAQASRDAIQWALKPDMTFGDNDLWRSCHQRLLSTQPECVRHVKLSWSKECFASLNDRLMRLRDTNPGVQSDAWDLAADLFESAGQEAGAKHNKSLITACGIMNIGHGGLEREQLRGCLRSRCLTPEAPKAFHGEDTALISTDDFLLRDATLELATSSLSSNRSFFATLITTGTHFPYSQPPPSKWLDQGARPRYNQYLDRVRQSDLLAREIYTGLGKQAGRVLFIVVGDHGEAFGEEGHYQHGSCVSPHCLWVPLIVHMPVAVHASKMRPISQPRSSGGSAQSHPRVAMSHHADVYATILEWSGYTLRNSSVQGTSLRRGQPLTRARGVRQCSSAFAFFNPSVRAAACAISPAGQRITGNEAIDYLLFEPRRASKATRMRIVVNASAPRGLHISRDGRRSDFMELQESATRARLASLRLSVSYAYERWLQLKHLSPRWAETQAGVSSLEQLAHVGMQAAAKLRPVAVLIHNLHIQLQHAGTGCRLQSENRKYPNGSQQQIASCHVGQDENYWWKIVAGNESTPQGGPIRHGDVVHLEHVATGCKLRSHDVRSAVTGQTEVSCYAAIHGDDDNDDWRVKMGTSETSVRFQHVSTAVGKRGHYLHSHHDRYPAWGLEHQEVTTFDGGDANDYWTALEKDSWCAARWRATLRLFRLDNIRRQGLGAWLHHLHLGAEYEFTRWANASCTGCIRGEGVHVLEVGVLVSGLLPWILFVVLVLKVPRSFDRRLLLGVAYRGRHSPTVPM